MVPRLGLGLVVLGSLLVGQDLGEPLIRTAPQRRDLTAMLTTLRVLLPVLSVVRPPIALLMTRVDALHRFEVSLEDLLRPVRLGFIKRQLLGEPRDVLARIAARGSLLGAYQRGAGHQQRGVERDRRGHPHRFDSHRSPPVPAPPHECHERWVGFRARASAIRPPWTVAGVGPETARPEPAYTGAGPVTDSRGVLG